MPALNLDVLPEQPINTCIHPAVYREGLLKPFESLSNEQIIQIACNADARKAAEFRDLITLTLIEE